MDFTPLLFTGLSFFAANHFIRVLDTLSFIRFRLALEANLRRILTDLFLVNPSDDDLVLSIHNGFQSIRIFHFHRVGISQR